MDERIEIIKKWLGTGSINIFGMPFSGKDTVGIHLAEVLGAKFLSSGLILRAAESEDSQIKDEMAAGQLVNTDKFREIVLPYLEKTELSDFPLVLSSVGRWEGEEISTIDRAEQAGHPIKAVIILNLSETEIRKRWEVSRASQDRGERLDDRNEHILDTRIAEFNEKTRPVIETYQKHGLIVPIDALGTRDEVFSNTIDSLMHFALNNERKAVQGEVVVNIANNKPKEEEAELDPDEEDGESIVESSYADKEEE